MFLKFPILDSRGLLFHVSTLASGSPRLALQEPSTRRPETSSKAKLAACALAKLEPTTAQPHTPSSPPHQTASQPPHVPSSHQETRQAPSEGGSAKAKLRSTSWEFLGCLPISPRRQRLPPRSARPPFGRRRGQPGDVRMEIRRASPDSGLAWRRFGGTPLTPTRGDYSSNTRKTGGLIPRHHSSDVRHSAGDAGRRRRSADASHTSPRGLSEVKKAFSLSEPLLSGRKLAGDDFIGAAGFLPCSFHFG
ncbi:hypothetical protein CKAH01_05359 [Colletotrichum kahawae]|uniref:Uncharacterized protein n=1 Tax=Colletotrichum kahawae TaxID=34407 RepID=A0AAD9YFG0_COLKA|nr:hypothetical protein CKAH01_05359 [Colletotrichum kahawae]